MNKRERLEAAIQFKEVDRIPWTMYKSLTSWGKLELEYRKSGLTSIYQNFPIANTYFDDIEVTENNNFSVNSNKERSGRNIITRVFKTPVGNVSAKQGFLNYSIPVPNDIIGRYTSEIDQEVLAWWVEHPFKSFDDYKVLGYIYKNIKYRDNFKQYLYTDKIIGDEGYIIPSAGRTPFSTLLHDVMGVENCYLELYSNPRELKSLLDIIYENALAKYEIAAESPANIIHLPENLTSILVSPTIFKEFYMPFYRDVTSILHKKGKYLAIHMDGNLSQLKNLISKTDVDIIEAFTPLPTGNMSLKEARDSWPDKVIWMNFPGAIFATHTVDMVEEYTIKMLESLPTAQGLIIGCTENFPLEQYDRFGGVSQAISKFSP